MATPILIPGIGRKSFETPIQYFFRQKQTFENNPTCYKKSHFVHHILQQFPDLYRHHYFARVEKIVQLVIKIVKWHKQLATVNKQVICDNCLFDSHFIQHCRLAIYCQICKAQSHGTGACPSLSLNDAAFQLLTYLTW